MRFRVDDTAPGGMKLFSRGEVAPDLSFDEAHDPPMFLARLWALFGPAGSRDGGFEYRLRDRETGLGFTAYAGASGPAYGGGHGERAALEPVLRALERLLAATAPVACEVALVDDVEYGGDAIVMGYRDGQAFRRRRVSRTAPATAASLDDCVAIAAEHETRGYPGSGWRACLDQVLPEPPASFHWRHGDYDECLGFCIDEAVPVMIFIGLSGSPTNIPVDEIPFEAMPPIARLWLDAYARHGAR